MCIHMAGSLVVQQKLTQHCKETIFHFLKEFPSILFLKNKCHVLFNGLSTI